MDLTSCPGGAPYIWQPGDSVPALAERLNTTEQVIWQMNGLRNLDELIPGDEICIPAQPLSCAEGTLYTLKENDTLISIAQAVNVSIAELLEQNPYFDPETMTAGQILCLPEKSVSPSPPEREYLVGVVRYGQTITDILLEYDISYGAFLRANPTLNPELLLPGQRYLVPPSGTRGLCPHYSYVVLEGDTLSSIARQFDLSESQLLHANPDLAPGDFGVGRTICLQKE